MTEQEKSTELRSITTADEYGNPLMSFVPGLVDADTFNRAHLEAGWIGDPMPESELSYYWLVEEGGFYRRAAEGDEGAKGYTGFEW